MVTLDCSCTHRDGVTLVTATLTVPEEPTRVTVRNRLDGPVKPPRCEGRPEAGWSESGYESVLEPGTHALGYAVDAPPAEPPAAVVDATPADGSAETEYTAADVVRELGDPSPPTDAVPTGSSLGGLAAGPGSTAGEPRPTGSLPDDVVDWLDTVARRVEHAERLAAADSRSAATDAVRDAGGLAGVREIADSGATDERMLRDLARRAERLADRRAGTSVPVETLARLA